MLSDESDDGSKAFGASWRAGSDALDVEQRHEGGAHGKP